MSLLLEKKTSNVKVFRSSYETQAPARGNRFIDGGVMLAEYGDFLRVNGLNREKEGKI